MRSTTPIPGWLIFVGSTLVAIGVIGTVAALLLTNRMVPDRLYDLVLVIGVAYFGAGPFLVQHQNQTGMNAALVDTVNHHTDVLHTAIKAMAGTNQESSTPSHATTVSEAT